LISYNIIFIFPDTDLLYSENMKNVIRMNH